MSEIKALEKLRTMAKRIDDAAAWASEHGYSPMGISAIQIADEIEAEINERFMELPLDAYGVPIHPGDCMTDGSMRADNLGVARWDVVSVNGCAFFDMSNSAHFANQCTHYHAPTVEDVLEEFGPRWMDTFNPVDRTELVTRYADKLREVMKDE